MGCGVRETGRAVDMLAATQNTAEAGRRVAARRVPNRCPVLRACREPKSQIPAVSVDSVQQFRSICGDYSLLCQISPPARYTPISASLYI